MKKAVILFALILITSSVQASIRSLYQEKSNLFLHEKIAQPENLLDNPAQLNHISQYLIENNSDLQLQTIKPYDPVFRKENHDDFFGNTGQVIVPIEKWACINVGYAYEQWLDSQESISTLDGSRIAAADKQFVKTINAAVATTQILGLELGYAITIQEQTHFIDYAADIANDYSYTNNSQTTQHFVGIIYDDIEIYGGMSSMQAMGDYIQTREIEFSLDSWEVNVRRLFGNMGAENVLVQAGMGNYQLTQTVFEIGRTGYDLDILNYEVAAGAYYTNPGKQIDFSVGLELTYLDNTIFNVSDYVWENYQSLSGTLPAQIKATVFPWLALWLEMRLLYQENTYEKAQTTMLQSALGVQVNIEMLEIQVYTLPGFTITNSESSDTIQNIQIGITAILRF
ncbi:hypothetical protein K8S19_08670 [bacterium]|nr:hypothetical protein [bacterium]